MESMEIHAYHFNGKLKKAKAFVSSQFLEKTLVESTFMSMLGIIANVCILTRAKRCPFTSCPRISIPLSVRFSQASMNFVGLEQASDQ
ncbi:hypothetical protein T09_3299 [Trichinella sp. T9]|nr:hypothetical protein T09_3299 [Trichinella sp. T9]